MDVERCADSHQTPAMPLARLVAEARSLGASDLHLEAGLPAAVRVRGALRSLGEPVPGRVLAEIAHDLVGPETWPAFLERRSHDLSKTLSGVRCRINLLHSARGIGLAVRLLSAFQATVERLNLHPELTKLVEATTGLILVAGPTGSGKSSTLAALIQEINLTGARHVVTIENPIEYTFRPRHAFIRQREVGRDTPSFEQALLDALREDPDVLVVGEMREPETMRLTLNAAETGHLVLATAHSGTCAEALQRIALAFPSEIQGSVCAQLADCLLAVICQRLRFRPDLGIRVPECEILRASHATKAFIRNRDFFKIPQALETGADQGMWTFARYQNWLSRRTQWHIPSPADEAPDSESDRGPMTAGPSSGPAPGSSQPARSGSSISISSRTTRPASSAAPSSALADGPRRPATTGKDDRIEIEPVEGGLPEAIRRLT